MTNRIYDVFKWLSLVAIDALGLLYSTLATIWNLPYGDEVLRTCAAVSMCVGTLIGISGVQYQRSLRGEGSE